MGSSNDKSNRQLCAEFRALLTTGFYASPGVDPGEALAITKPWRNDLWRAFRELEDRLCPLEALAREKAKNNVDTHTPGDECPTR